MNDRFLIDSAEESPQARLFFAIFPDVDAATRLEALADSLRLQRNMTSRAVTRGRLHTTLYFLGEYDALPTDIVARARTAASTVGLSPFAVEFDCVQSFAGRQGQLPLVLCGGDNTALIELQRALAQAIQKTGLVAKSRMQFTPHVTLLYGDQRVEASLVDAIHWQVNEFALVHSQSGQSDYTVLARWSLGGSLPRPEDSHYMARALELAGIADDAGEVPVGAVVVRNGKIIGEGWNQPIGTNDPTAHAEMVAIRQAAQAIGSYRLLDATIYVTLEPCAMCAGAMVHSRLKRLVYGASDPRAGAAGSAFNLVQSDALNHRVECTVGLMEADCARQLREFFRARR